MLNLSANVKRFSTNVRSDSDKKYKQPYLAKIEQIHYKYLKPWLTKFILLYEFASEVH